MSRLHISFIVFAVIITLGLAVSLQGVLGINIGNVLNLGGNKITNVGAPTAAGDVAVKSYVDSVAGAHVSGGLYGFCANSFWTDALGNPFSACGAKASASCSPQNICVCPVGYTMEQVSATVSGTSQSYKNTCYKN